MRRGFTIHHNGPPAKCVGRDHKRCIAFWHAVKAYHVNTRGWSDIAYSFGVCPHGTRFEGRGWVKSQWANGDDVVGPNNGRDREWYTVLAFIGMDETVHEQPTPEMVEALRALIAQGRNHGRCGLEVLPHNAFKVKPCPGPELTAVANLWHNSDFLDLPPQEDDMPLSDDDLDRIGARVQAELKKGTGTGQPDWPSTNKAILSTVQAVYNAVANPSKLAADLAARLPQHDVSAEHLEAALRSIFAELGDG